MRIQLTILFIGVMSLNVTGQLLDSTQLDTVKKFTSLESALQNPDQVYWLELKRERIKTFPEEIFQLKNLNYLDLSKNKLKEVPGRIRELKYLQHIDLEKNRLEEFPLAVTELVHLKRLIFSQNDIDSIPDEIRELKELQAIEAWSTNLHYLSPYLADLENLRFLELRVINFTQKEKDYIIKLLPDAEILLSNSCNCGG